MSAYRTTLGVLLLAGLAAAFTVCLWVPSPVTALLPLNVAAAEWAPRLLLFDALGGVIAAFLYRRMLPLFVAAAALTAWPVWQARQLEREMARQFGCAPREIQWFGGPPRVRAVSRELPLGIRYYAPQGAGPRPVLIDIHGGGWQHGTALSDDRFNSYMARAGYAVFALDYRQAPAFQFPAQLEDVRTALDWVRQHAAEFRGDPARILLCGRSAGAELALLAAYASDLPPVRGVVSFYAPTDLALGYSRLPSPDPLDVRSVLRAYLGGPPPRPQYALASPVNLVRPGLPPTLLLQGGRDHIVKPEFARELRDRLQAQGDSVVLLELPWSEHGFDLLYSGMGHQIALQAVELFAQRVSR